MVDSATEDLESACDRSVIKGRDRRFVEQYAQTLLDTAKFLLERQRRHPDAAGLLPVQQRTAAEKAADCPVFAGGSQRSPVGAVCRGADDAGDLYCIKRILLKGNSKSAGDYRL